MYEDEKIFREKLRAFGITDPIIRSKDGVLYAEPSPVSYRSWKATYEHENSKKFSFEEFKRRK